MAAKVFCTITDSKLSLFLALKAVTKSMVCYLIKQEGRGIYY